MQRIYLTSLACLPVRFHLGYLEFIRSFFWAKARALF